MEMTLTIKRDIPQFRMGDKVQLRGDMGSFKMTILKIHNEWYATCSFQGTKRHINMIFLTKVKE